MIKQATVVLTIVLTSFSNTIAGGIEVGNGKTINTNVIVGTQFEDRNQPIDFINEIMRQNSLSTLEQIAVVQDRADCNVKHAIPKKIELVEYYEIINMQISTTKKVSALMEVQLKNCLEPQTVTTIIPRYLKPFTGEQE